MGWPSGCEFNFVEISAGGEVVAILVEPRKYFVHIVVVVGFEHRIAPAVEERNVVDFGIVPDFDIFNDPQIILLVCSRGNSAVYNEVAHHFNQDYRLCTGQIEVTDFQRQVVRSGKGDACAIDSEIFIGFNLRCGTTRGLLDNGQGGKVYVVVGVADEIPKPIPLPGRPYSSHDSGPEFFLSNDFF